MAANIGKALPLLLGLVAATPAIAQKNTVEIPLSDAALRDLGSTLSEHSGATMMVGSVGLDSRAGSHREVAPYNFNIPSERPFQKVPGVMFKFPLGDTGSH